MYNLRASSAFILGFIIFGTIYFRFDYIYDVFNNPVGTVKSKLGSASTVKPNELTSVKLNKDSSVINRAIIKTDNDSSLEIAMFDGTTLMIQENSIVQISVENDGSIDAGIFTGDISISGKPKNTKVLIEKRKLNRNKQIQLTQKMKTPIKATATKTYTTNKKSERLDKSADGEEITEQTPSTTMSFLLSDIKASVTPIALTAEKPKRPKKAKPKPKIAKKNKAITKVSVANKSSGISMKSFYPNKPFWMLYPSENLKIYIKILL